MNPHNWNFADDGATRDLRTLLTRVRAYAPEKGPRDTGMRHYIDLGGDLLWHRAGMVRYFPHATVVNLLATYDDYAAMKEGGRITEIPPAAYMLNWDDAQPLSEHPEERLDGGDAS